jgi:hypothetical protein
VDLGGIYERDLLDALLGRDQCRLYPPRGRQPLLTLQILPPLRHCRDLDAPDPVKAGFPVEVQLRVTPDGVLGELGHRLRRIGLEHLPGAWEVDPPVLKSGRPSRTTTSRQPIRVRCSATPQPTMPAPMITMPVLSSIAKPPSVSEAMARHPSTWDEVGGSVPARRQCPLLLEGRRPAFALVPYNGPLPYIGTLNIGLLLGQGGAVGWRPSA